MHPSLPSSTEFQLRMIVKSMPTNLSRRKTFRSEDFFRNECHFYDVVLKKYAEFRKAKGERGTDIVASLVYFFDHFYWYDFSSDKEYSTVSFVFIGQ